MSSAHVGQSAYIAGIAGLTQPRKSSLKRSSIVERSPTEQDEAPSSSAAPPMSEFAAAQLRLSVAGCNPNRCGHKTIDVELVIIARALQRLGKHLRRDAVGTFEVRVVQQSVARIAKVLRSLHVRSAENAGDDAFDATLRSTDQVGASDDDDDDEDDDAAEELVEEVDDEGEDALDVADADNGAAAISVDPAPPVEPAPADEAGLGLLAGHEGAAGSPSRMLLSAVPQRRQPGARGKKGGLGLSMSNDPALQALRYRARNGLWPQLLAVARAAQGTYSFVLDAAEVRAQAAVLTRDAPAFGLANVANRLVLTRHPQIKLVSVTEPPPGPVHAKQAHQPSSSTSAPSPLSGTSTSRAEAVRTAFLASAPSGIIDVVRQRGLQCRPSASSAWGKATADGLLAKGAVPFMTQEDDEPYVSVDFFNALVMPTAYAFTSLHHIIPGYFPRTWQLLGSLDGLEWTVLSDHVDDDAFDADRQTVVFRLKEPPKQQPQPSASPSGKAAVDDALRGVYRHLRLVNRGPNSSGGMELQAHGFEVYGNLLFVQPDEPEKHGLTGPIARTPPSLTPPEPVNIAALTAKSKKKGK